MHSYKLPGEIDFGVLRDAINKFIKDYPLMRIQLSQRGSVIQQYVTNVY